MSERTHVPVSLVSLDTSWWSFAVQEKLLVANQITTLPPQESQYHTQFILPPYNCQMWILSNSFENAAFQTLVETPIKSLRPSVAEAHELLRESSFIGFWAVFRFFNWCFYIFFFDKGSLILIFSEGCICLGLWLHMSWDKFWPKTMFFDPLFDPLVGWRWALQVVKNATMEPRRQWWEVH